MVATIVLPDHCEACRVLLTGDADLVHAPVAAYITELTTVYITSDAWINHFIPNPEQLPRNAIRIRPAGGFGDWPDDRKVNATRVRAQFECFGESEGAAMKIAMLLHNIFSPMQRNMQGFRAANTRITQTLGITGPVPATDPDIQPLAPSRVLTVDFEMLKMGVA
jgi:hypothetical protein